MFGLGERERHWRRLEAWTIMANLEDQKKDMEAVVHNIMLGDMKLGVPGVSSKETQLFLDVWTRPENLGDLFVTIKEITLN